ncbi:MAG: HD domain-containing protein [Deltaproteobacteria bacterium]|nr:HD domain-containing protein [Deltaproteobacteria bacterium]
MSTLTQDVNALTLLSLLSSHADFVYAHCVAVSFVGTLLARQVEWTSPPNLFKVAMGGLLHDIGLKEVDIAVLSKPRSEYTADEARLYDSHGLRGRDILSTMPNIPTDIIQIVMQHHEDCSGNGTPFGLKRDRIHPLARLLSVADVFCELILKNPNHDGIPPSDAIERMNQLHRGSLDGTFLDALALVFKVAPAVKKAS